MSPASAETGQRGRNSEEASVGGKDAASLKQRMQSWLEQRAGERVQGGWGGGLGQLTPGLRSHLDFVLRAMDQQGRVFSRRM